MKDVNDSTNFPPPRGGQEGLVSILGCGWLGLPLAKELVKAGHTVKGSTTTQEKMKILSSEGIEPFLIAVSSEGISGNTTDFLAETDILIINIPPGLRKNPNTNFVGGIEKFVWEIEKSRVKKVLFVSSTSVYKDTLEIPTYSEKDEPNGTSEAAKQLTSAEKILTDNPHFTTTILRFGGLIGENRHPVKFLSGRKGIKNPLAPVNFIHQKDCIGILLKILEKDKFGEIFNAVNPVHSSRESYYQQKARELDLAVPKFNHQIPSEGKIIDSSKIMMRLGYQFNIYNL